VIIERMPLTSSLKYRLSPLLTIVLIVLLSGVLSENATAQRKKSSHNNKKRDNELSIGFGAANYLGDLGGLDKVGSDFVWDLEFSTTRPAAQISYIHFWNRTSGIRSQFNYLQVRGDDALTNEKYRSYRNLSFKCNIFELAFTYEYHFIREKMSHKFDLRDQRMRRIGLKGHSPGAYVFAGISGFYFNPKATLDGGSVALQPLGTEGQGLEGGPEPYQRISVGFPLGAGIRIARSNRIVLSLNLAYRFTITDYIDDVSGTYYDNTAIEQIRGPIAAALADPSVYPEEYHLTSGETQGGVQRGDPTDKDGFFLAMFSINYKMRPTYNSRKRNMYRAKINKSIRF
jgi:hypothetical protein